MRSLSDLTNEQLMELIEEIKKKNGGETDAKNWSHEDIERLLELTDRGKQLEELDRERDGVPEEQSASNEDFSESEAEPTVEETEEPDEVQTKDAEEAEIVIEGQTGQSVDGEIDDDEFEAESLENAVKFLSGEMKTEKEESIKPFDISEEHENTDGDDRLKSIMTDVAPLKEEEAVASAKKSLSEFAKKIKISGKKIFESFKNKSEKKEETSDEVFDDELEEKEEEDVESISFPEDEKTRQIPTLEATREVYIEKPGFVIKKGEAQEDLEGAPIIMSADDALEDEKAAEGEQTPAGDFQNKIRDAELGGQMVFSGMDTEDEAPNRIDESEAEKELFEKRKEKISKFSLLEKDENGDPYGLDPESSKIGELFASNEERPRRKESESFVGIEYSQTKDSRRVIRYLNTQKKKSLNKIVGLGVVLGLTVFVSIFSASATTIAGDRILTIFSNFVLLCAGLVVANQSIVGSFEMLRRKKMNINTMISISAIICFFQSLLMLIFYFADKNTVSVFSGAGLVLLLTGEINNYIVHSRTVDAMEMCTGDNKDKLYSIEGISDDKDAVELAKNVKNTSPRIRFSCKTKFPAHLIELCMSETSADKMTRFLLPLTALLALINLAIAWAVKRDFATGFAAFSITFAMCVPAYAPLLYELPLSRANKKFNKEGGMISCQDAVNELCRTNVVIIDSKDLFDQKACSMHGFKDFKNVRLDDAMLYAAAMVIRSGGPLMGVFDQVVVNRRDLLPAVKSFSYEEKQGISGWIFGQKVVLGNRLMMVNHNIQIPETVDEDKYLIAGHEVLYLGIAHKLAAMMVVDYAPNEQIRPYLLKLRDSGVSILVRNCDPNVNEAMISSCFDMRLNNIKILNSSSGRIFKKYKSRPKLSARAVAIHDGTPYTFMKSLCLASTLRQMFKVSGLLTMLGILMGFVIVLILSAMNVICDLPQIFVLLMQILVTFGFIGIVNVVSIGNSSK